MRLGPCWLLLLLLLLWGPQTSTAFLGSWFWSFWTSGSEQPPGLSCRDGNNNDVPWYILYKAPGGQNYIYISPYGIGEQNTGIGAADGVLGRTLRPLWDSTMPNTFGFLSYSDGPPDGKSVGSKYGHSKGVLLWDSASHSAVWITHSAPRFPFSRNMNNFWPESGNRNGQTFMCLTLSYSQLPLIRDHLLHIRAFVFDERNSDGFFKDITDSGNNKAQAPPLQPHLQSLRVGNWELKVVAKGTSATPADGDLYVLLSQIFESEMNAQTWGCQKDKDMSFCEPNKPKVFSVLNVTTNLGDWGWTKDHSKWAVTKDKQWTCIADMNRAQSQYERPGGALCIQDPAVSEWFRRVVKVRLPCGVLPKYLPGNCEESPDEEELADTLQESRLNREL